MGPGADLGASVPAARWLSRRGWQGGGRSGRNACGGAANGHFTCLLAGRSAILGLRLKVVQGGVTQGVAHADGSVTFRGVATVNLGNGQQFRGVPFVVTVTAGGPGVGTLQ
jgi:hypothetical protein